MLREFFSNLVRSFKNIFLFDSVESFWDKTDDPVPPSPRWKFIVRDWDRILVHGIFVGYALFSLFSTATISLQTFEPYVWIKVLFAQLALGSSCALVGIFTRYYQPQLLGGIVAQIAVTVQLGIALASNGVTAGDFLLAVLLLEMISVTRRLRWRQKTLMELISIRREVTAAVHDNNLGNI